MLKKFASFFLSFFFLSQDVLSSSFFSAGEFTNFYEFLSQRNNWNFCILNRLFFGRLDHYHCRRFRCLDDHRFQRRFLRSTRPTFSTPGPRNRPRTTQYTRRTPSFDASWPWRASSASLRLRPSLQPSRTLRRSISTFRKWIRME